MEDTQFASQHFSILTLNIRCFLARIDQLSVFLNLYDIDIVFLQETWLFAQSSPFSIHGYSIVARRDRSDNENRGGVLILSLIHI